MRFFVRFPLVSALAAVALVGAALGMVSLVEASTPRVVMIDNDAPLPNQGIDPRTGEWGFSPVHVAVVQGEAVVFDNPAGNFRPHNVVSVATPGQPFPPAREVGAAFSSGLTRESIINAGGSWTLDTSGVAPGHYGYFCSLHPWMVGSITVLQP